MNQEPVQRTLLRNLVASIPAERKFSLVMGDVPYEEQSRGATPGSDNVSGNDPFGSTFGSNFDLSGLLDYKEQRGSGSPRKKSSSSSGRERRRSRRSEEAAADGGDEKGKSENTNNSMMETTSSLGLGDTMSSAGFGAAPGATTRASGGKPPLPRRSREGGSAKADDLMSFGTRMRNEGQQKNPSLGDHQQEPFPPTPTFPEKRGVGGLGKPGSAGSIGSHPWSLSEASTATSEGNISFAQ